MNIKSTMLAVAVGALFLSCGKNKEGGTVPVEGVATYVTLEISLPAKKISRALPEDYNEDGIYIGNDGVQTLDVYMESADGTIEAKRFVGTGIATDGTTISPSEPFRTTSGTKTVYVIINDPQPLRTSITSEQQLVDTEGLASIVTVDGETFDLITMTGKAENVIIAPDIPVTGVTGGENRVAVTVDRVASRVIVTLDPAASPNLTNEEGEVIGTVSNITWSVAQGTTQIYWLPQPGFITYGYNYVPVLGDYYDGDALQYYDYSDLSTPTPVPVLPTAGDGYKSLPGKFLFENTHQYGATTTNTGYRKGNTAYVLVKAIFTPVASAIVDGGMLTNGTFYYGYSDGLIYSSKTAAQAAVQNQRVAVYQGGEMLNFAWLNPDNIAEPLNSPVIRNNIYHINITGFRRVGYNWNPLYPEDPDTPTPANPDPKPNNPDEPDIDIDPIDPLTPEQTYMTVDVTVQDWYVHSYDIEF